MYEQMTATAVRARQVRRIEDDMRDLNRRLSGAPRPVGLRARSVHGFLSALRDHKRGQVDSLS